MKPVMLYSGGLDSFVLAADLILNPFRHGFPKGSVPALVHFSGNDAVHKHTSDLFLTKQLPYLERLAKKPVLYRALNTDDILITHPCTKPRARGVSLTHKARFNSHDIGRQVLYLATAFNYASEFDSDFVFAAFQMDEDYWAEYEAEPELDVSEDTPKFRDYINGLCDIGGFVPGQRLRTPFLDGRMSKYDIINLGNSLRLPLNITYSCVHSAPKACGKCNACLIYKAAVKKLGYDPRKTL